MNAYIKYFGCTLLVIAIDQAVKMWVHFQMDFGSPGQILIFGDWFKLHYTTNPGMAFGMELGSVDSVFYGVWLDNAPYNAPTPWFHGQVVDMFYFDIWEGYIPEWMPLWGGQYTALWPIFNVADASIFIGVTTILLFQNKFFPEAKPKEPATDQEPS